MAMTTMMSGEATEATTTSSNEGTKRMEQKRRRGRQRQRSNAMATTTATTATMKLKKKPEMSMTNARVLPPQHVPSWKTRSTIACTGLSTDPDTAGEDVDENENCTAVLYRWMR